MDKRQFLVAGSVGAIVPARAGAGAPTAPARSGGALLTVVGALPHANRGPLDPVLDQLMVKHKVAFDKAWQFDAAALARLPAVTIEPTLEYDAKPHKLSGPLLAAVIVATGIAANAAVTLTLRALDGYAVGVSLADASRYRMIVATAVDGVPLGIGGLGPLWAVYDADRLPDFKDRPLQQRFALCPWGLYLIEVKSA
jgi:hypothetical protein